LGLVAQQKGLQMTDNSLKPPAYPSDSHELPNVAALDPHKARDCPEARITGRTDPPLGARDPSGCSRTARDVAKWGARSANNCDATGSASGCKELRTNAPRQRKESKSQSPWLPLFA
jgi:CubicO group peptidase (beta-lactamase class C family)